MNKNLQDLLNRQVANQTVFYMKLHNFHWFVKGMQFVEMHELFEKLYDEAHEHIDEIAERVLMLGGKPIATLKEVLELATLKEANGKETTTQMLEAVIEDFEHILIDLKQGIKLAEEDEDEVTIDLFIGMIAGIEKHLWFLRTMLK